VSVAKVWEAGLKAGIVGSAGLIACLAAGAAHADVYVNQMDNSSRAGGAYVEQMPADARPIAPRPQKQRVVRKKASAPAVMLPNVGAGVTLAMASSTTADQLPSVGSGVIRR
jgi:hypothetical protein